MAKMRNWSKGLKAGNRPVGDSDIFTLKHIKYQPIEDKVVADRPITTTLNSLYLGGKHKMSSGAENVFFTNLDSYIHWFPVWQGIKDHSVLDNHGPSGILPPTARVYDNNATTLDLGVAEKYPIEYVPYRLNHTLPVPISGLGLKFRVGQFIEKGTKLILSVTDTKSMIEEFRVVSITDKDHSVGDWVQYWYDHPMELNGGNNISVDMYIEGQGSILVSSDLNGRPYDVGTFRLFNDIPITLESDLGKSEYALASMHDYNIADSLHLKDCQVLTMDDGVTLLFNT